MSANAALAFAAEPLASASPTIVVSSEVLGELRVPIESVLTFPAGLFGFPEGRRFALVPAGREGLYWLQSLEHSTLAFLLADPFQFFRGYAVELTSGDRLELGAHGAADVAVLAIVTLPQSRGAPPTANLQGPVALNLRAGIGRQLAIANGEWGVRCAFEP